ncbi:MAG: hypothetical protein NE330_21895 [Lentisphaeraceae bacterium]|nr:hypothetical protein [Lentisphaeraceae bacterium]
MNISKILFIGCFCFILNNFTQAEQLIFKDDFSSKTLNKKWLFYTSDSVLENGRFVCKMPKDSNHSSFNYLNLSPIKNFEVSLRFKFNGGKYFNIGLMDREYKGAHAGHICNAYFTEKFVTLREGKHGVFDHAIRAELKSGKVSQKTKKMLQGKEKTFKFKFVKGNWYTVNLSSIDDTLVLSVNGKKLGELKSKGIAHATKRRLGLSVWGKTVEVDDFVLKSMD